MEFALVSTLLLTLLFGIVDFGRALFDYNSVAHAAQLATRFALVNASNYCINNGDSSTVAQCKSLEVSQFETAIGNYVATRVPGGSSLVLTYAFPSTSDCTASSQPSSYQIMSPLCEITVTASVPFSFTFGSFGSFSLGSTATQIFTN